MVGYEEISGTRQLADSAMRKPRIRRARKSPETLPDLLSQCRGICRTKVRTASGPTWPRRTTYQLHITRELCDYVSREMHFGLISNRSRQYPCPIARAASV